MLLYSNLSWALSVNISHRRNSCPFLATANVATAIPFLTCVPKPYAPVSGGVRAKRLPQGVKVRVKNKGDQKHKRGPKRPKFQAPVKEHAQTNQQLNHSDIHANHVEANNAAIHRLYNINASL